MSSDACCVVCHRQCQNGESGSEVLLLLMWPHLGYFFVLVLFGGSLIVGRGHMWAFGAQRNAPPTTVNGSADINWLAGH